MDELKPDLTVVCATCLHNFEGGIAYVQHFIRQEEQGRPVCDRMLAPFVVDYSNPQTPAEHIAAAHDRVLREGVPAWDRPDQGALLRQALDAFPKAAGVPPGDQEPIAAPHLKAYGGDPDRHRKLVEKCEADKTPLHVRRDHTRHATGCAWLHPTYGDCTCGAHDDRMPAAVRTEHQGD